METIAQMTRSHSESLQSLATAQADWIKDARDGEADPPQRGDAFRAGCCPSSSDGRDVEDTPSWLRLLQPAMPAIANAVIRNVGSWLGGGAAPSTVARSTVAPAKHRNFSQLAAISEREKKAPPTFDEHIAAVCALLAPRGARPDRSDPRTARSVPGSPDMFVQHDAGRGRRVHPHPHHEGREGAGRVVKRVRAKNDNAECSCSTSIPARW